MKFIIEIVPLILFFISYKYYDIMTATIVIAVSSVLSVILSMIMKIKINKVNIISVVLLLITSTITIVTKNSSFIKMKPTLVYLIFAIIFIVTNYKYKPAIEFIFKNNITFKNRGDWLILNRRFAGFFLFMACLNEFIWRNYAESTWVSFKVFGAMPITILFIILQIPFILKAQKDKNN